MEAAKQRLLRKKRGIGMRILTKALMVTVLVLVCGGAAYAVPPAYTGRLGNPEEPAMRPYKWFWRGIKALVYQPAAGFKNGNAKTPGIGSVEVFRGIRKGTVELGYSVAKGVVGAVPPKADDYKNTGKANAFIDNEPFLRTMSDFVATAGPVGLGVAAVEAPAQIVVDKHLLYGSHEQEVNKERAAAARTAQRESLPEATAETSVERAQKLYLGERYVGKKQPAYTGNILRKPRE